MPEQEPAVNREKIEVKEIVEAIQNLKNGKAIGPEELHKVFKILLKRQGYSGGYDQILQQDI